MTTQELDKLATEFVRAYAREHNLGEHLIPHLVERLFHSLETAEFTERDPHVPIKESVTDDYIVCLEDGCKVTDLTRHLRTAHDMTPAQYRAKWYLPISYPMTAPNQAKKH